MSHPVSALCESYCVNGIRKAPCLDSIYFLEAGVAKPIDEMPFL